MIHLRGKGADRSGFNTLTAGRPQVLVRDLLNHPFRGLQDQPAPFSVQRNALVADLPDQEYGLADRFVQRQGQLVLPQSLLNGLAHLRFYVEKTVCGNASLDALVGTEMVVMGDKMRQTFLGLGKVLWLDPSPEFLAHRFPETLTLAQGFGMVGAGDHMADALLLQQLLKIALAAPGEILPALVREDFQRLAPALDAFQQGFFHEFLGLSQTQTPRDDITAVVVQEDH